MGFPVNEFLVGDALEQLRRLPAQSVHCVVTSPPYFRLRDYGVPGQIGLEASGEEYLDRMVQVFRLARRVLRRDGTLWLNMGDGYVGSGRGNDYDSSLEGSRDHQAECRKVGSLPRWKVFGLPEKSLIGMPWRLALALQADGWLLRQDNIWHKRNVMPESCRDRTTRAHEYLFQFARSGRYFYDAIAVEEPQSEHERSYRLRQQARGVTTVYKLRRDSVHGQVRPGSNGAARSAQARQALALKGTRNRRSVWSIASKPFKEAHFAVFPEQLVEPCILAGTSEKGCCQICGAPIARQILATAEYARLLQENLGKNHNKDRAQDLRSGRYGTAIQRHHNVCANYQTTGWKRTCRCTLSGSTPCIVLDPFAGAGTTALVALKLGRRFIGIELNPEYAEMARRRVAPLMGGGRPKKRNERSSVNGRG